MANELVKYSNDIHTVALGKLKPADTRVFFSLCQKLREKGTDRVVFTWAELRKMANLTGNRDPKRFCNRLERITENLGGLMIKIRHDRGFSAFTLFQEFEVDIPNQTLTVSIAPRFDYLLNQLDANFVSWEMQEFHQLKGKYAQCIYRHLKQWRSTGIWDVSIEEFRRLLDVPKSYRMMDITRRVIEPAVAELRPFFSPLNWKYDKTGGPGGRGQGGRVERVVFTFQQVIDFKNLPDETITIESITPSQTKMKEYTKEEWEGLTEQNRRILKNQGITEPAGYEPAQEKPQLTRAQKEQLEMQEASYKAQLHRKLKEEKC